MTVRLIFLYIFFMAAASTRNIYFPYWMQSLGMSTAQIGSVLAVTTLIAIVAQPLLTNRCDRGGRPTLFLQWMLGLAWLVLLPLPWVLSPLVFAGLLWLQQPPNSVTLHVMDILLLRQKGQEGFGKIRLFGSLSYGLTVAFFGWMMASKSYHSAGKWAVWLYLVLFGATGLVALTLPRDEVPQETPDASTPPPSLKELFRIPGLLLFLFFNALHWVSVAFYDGFLSLHTRSLGFSNFVPGAAILVAVSAESLAFFFSRNLLRFRAPTWWLLLVFPMGALRWLLTALLPSKGWIIGLQSLHFFSYGLWMVIMMIMLDRFAPRGQRFGVQGLFAAVTFGIGGGLGQWAGGWLMQWAGGRGLYSTGAALELLALLGLWLTLSKWQPLAEEGAR